MIADSQERLFSKPTESDDFYKNCLATKLKQNTNSSLSSETTTTLSNQNLKVNWIFELKLGNLYNTYKNNFYKKIFTE